MRLCVGKGLAIGKGDLQLGVAAVEIVLQAVEVACALPLAHGQVVEQAVAAGLGLGGGNAVLGEYPLEALDGEAAHVLDGVCAGHYYIHAREAAHGSHIDDVVADGTVAEPCGHEVLQAVHGCRGDGGFVVGPRDAEVEGGKTLVLA